MTGCHEQMLPAELITVEQPPSAALEALRNMVLATRYNGWRYIAVSCCLTLLGGWDSRHAGSGLERCIEACPCAVWPALLASSKEATFFCRTSFRAI